MSFILDALQRAEAERTRGSVPGLHARQTALPRAHGAARPRWQWWLVLAVLLGLGALAVWYWQGLQVRQPNPVAASAAVTQPAVAAAPGVQPIVPVIAARPLAATASSPLANTRPVIAAASSAAPSQVLVDHAVEKPALPAEPARLPLLGELPAALRQQIPALTINGVVYSDQPAQRLLLVNNLVLNQGSQVAPELKLEEIHAKESMFSFRGTRFRLAH